MKNKFGLGNNSMPLATTSDSVLSTHFEIDMLTELVTTILINYCRNDWTVHSISKLTWFLQNALAIDDFDNDGMIEITFDDMKELNSVSTDQKYDATFIRMLLEILYKTNKSTLLHRSFSGQTRNSTQTTVDGDSSQKEQFKAVSPQKKQRIFSLFRDRIMHADTDDSQDKFLRLKSTNIGRLVAVGIANIRRSMVCHDLWFHQKWAVALMPMHDANRVIWNKYCLWIKCEKI